jgi:two-component system sensor histidine kinase/response regulator
VTFTDIEFVTFAESKKVSIGFTCMYILNLGFSNHCQEVRFDLDFLILMVISSFVNALFVFGLGQLFKDVIGVKFWVAGELITALGWLFLLGEVICCNQCFYEFGLLLLMCGLLILFIGFQKFFENSPSYWLFVFPLIFLFVLLYGFVQNVSLDRHFLGMLIWAVVIYCSLLFLSLYLFRSPKVNLIYKIGGIISFLFILIAVANEFVRGLFHNHAPISEVNTRNLFYCLAFCLSQLLLSLHILLMILGQLGSLFIGQLNNQKVFMKVVSHDLQNSIGSIVSLVRLLKYSNNKSVKSLDQLEQKAFYSQSLLQDMFQWVNVNDPTQLMRINNNLKILILRVVEFYSKETEIKKIEIKYNNKADFFVNIDERIVEVIFRNILSNAIKFSFEGSSIEIDYGIRGKTWFVSVLDHGEGMSPEKLIELQSGNSMNHSTKGTNAEIGNGLGITIVKDLVVMCNGFMKIESEVKIGTCVTFEIPLG